MLSIMIVDDESAIRKGLERCIDWEALGCNIFAEASDGIEALEQITPDSYPDVVITDIRMSGMYGLELCERLARDYPQIKIILLTVYQEFDYVRRALDFHVVDYLLKPVSPEKVIETIEKIKRQFEEEGREREALTRLQNSARQSDVLRRKMFLHELFDEGRGGSEEFDCGFERFILAAFTISTPVDQPSSPEQRTKLESFVDASFGEMTTFRLTRGRDMTLYLIIPMPDDAPESFYDEAAARCEDVSSMAYSFSDFSVAVGLSDAHDTLTDMPRAKNEVSEALQCARYEPVRKIMRFSQIKEPQQIAIDSIKALLGDLSAAIEERDVTQAQELARRMFDAAAANKYPLRELKSLAFMIGNRCTGVLWNYSFVKEYVGVLRDDFYHDVVYCEHSGRLREIVAKKIADVIADLDRQDVNKSKLISETEEYIREHYSEELSLDMLAEHVHVSSGYLSRFYKKETGANISAFIQQVRLEHAKQLLRKTDLKTYEIAESIGIGDPVYFSKIFKNHTGMTPKEYRQNG